MKKFMRRFGNYSARAFTFGIPKNQIPGTHKFSLREASKDAWQFI